MNFALIGVAGYIAPKHLKAIKDTGHRLVAALDPHDSVGVLDSFFPDARFFTEFERFDRHVEKLRRGPDSERVHVVSICSPNYLHDAHIRFALRVGADAICEKPIVLNSWNINALRDLEKEHHQRVYTVLQLRLHPTIVALREKLRSSSTNKRRAVELRYITPRGNWYHASWKGQVERSGGLATNIGIHLFDTLLWLFGKVQSVKVRQSEPTRVTGLLKLERADVDWFLSIDRGDLEPGQDRNRMMLVDGETIDFTSGFDQLHTHVYEDIFAGRGFGLEEAVPAIELCQTIRTFQHPVTPLAD